MYCWSEDTDTQNPESPPSEKISLHPFEVTLSNQPNLMMPATLAHTRIIPDEDPVKYSTITGILQNSVGVSANGQGGRLQNYSIRGVSRQRVMTMVSGVRIVTDRRAGTAASFVDPLLIDDLEVYRGASSTYFGSGAFGGAVNLYTKNFNQLQFTAGYESTGNENYQQIGWGNQNTSLGFSRRKAGNSDDPDDKELNTRFSQYTAVLSQKWSFQNHNFNLLLLPSLGKDIGKSNTDFPEKTTDYPTEKHVLVKFGADSEAHEWEADFALHFNTLDTRVNNIGQSENLVENTAYDLSGKLFQNWAISDVTGQTGFEYFGRRGVESTESIIDFRSDSTSHQTTLDDGRENELALFNHFNWNLGPGILEAGVRYTYFLQTQNASESVDRHIASGNLGYLLPLGDFMEFSGNFSTGFRMPSLSERFFSGTTGRGEVIGNPGLDPEYAYNFDLGISNFGERHRVSLHAFYNLIDDYIERVEVEDDVFTFINLTSGRIYGLELEGSFDLADDMLFVWNGAWMQGEDNNGRELNDIPANQVFFEYLYKPGKWTFGLQLRSLFKKNQTGPNEKKTPAANLFSASLGYEVNEYLVVMLTGKNLLGEAYFNSADKKAALEPGRSVGFYFKSSL